MDKLRCKNCNYRFNVSSIELTKLCPNCGKQNSLEKEKSAEEIMEEL